MSNRRLQQSVQQVRSALVYTAVLFGVEALACMFVPAEMVGEIAGLPFLAGAAALCAVGAGFGVTRAKAAPGEASLTLAISLTTGTFLSALVLGVPGMESVLALSMAALGYGSGAFLAVAAWFASSNLHGAPAVELRPVRRQPTRVARHRPTRSDSWAA